MALRLSGSEEDLKRSDFCKLSDHGRLEVVAGQHRFEPPKKNRDLLRNFGYVPCY